VNECKPLDLGTMLPAVVAAGALHIRTPLIISKPMSELLGRGLHSSTFQLNPGRF